MHAALIKYMCLNFGHHLQVTVYNCASAYSAASNLTTCTPQQKNLNGSAAGLYNDTSYYDDLTFAATWMYKATGDAGYLTEAEAFYVKHQYSTVRTQ